MNQVFSCPHSALNLNEANYLGHNIRDGGRADNDAVLVLEQYPCVNPGLQAEQWTAILCQD